MKQIIIMLLVAISTTSYGQSQNNHAAVSGYTIPVYAWIDKSVTPPDTIMWYWNSAEVLTNINASAATVTALIPINNNQLYNGAGYGTAASVTTVSNRIPISINTYSTTPLNHVSAAPHSICVDYGDTSIFVKVGSLSDSANWFKAR